MKKYSIEEIRNYLNSQDSLGDIYYNLSEEKIDQANEPSEKIKNAHNEMDREDKTEDLDTFEERGARVTLY